MVRIGLLTTSSRRKNQASSTMRKSRKILRTLKRNLPRKGKMTEKQIKAFFIKAETRIYRVAD